MQLNIIGQADKVSKQVIADAVYFYAEYLIRDSLLKNIQIDVDLEDGLMGTERQQAYCVNASEGRYAREFDICVDAGLGKRTMLMALAHEMVHVKQYATGELKYNRNQRLHRFQGIAYHPNYMYWEQPWEIEAFGRELGLYRMFCESEKGKAKCKK